MDPSEEQHDDDLFADLYGDDEPKSAPEPPKAAPAMVTAVAPTKQAAPNVAVPNIAAPNVAVPNVAAPEPSLSTSSMTNNSAPTAAPPKAVDPRAPQPPTEIQTDETFEADQQYDQSHAYSGWDASNMAPQQQQEQQQNQQQGHGGGETQGQGGYDHQPGSNSYGDHGNTGSPAIKEDGKMFIGGLNWETTDDSLKEYFSQFGEVTECTVMRDGPTGRSRGFGFLTFKDPKTVNIVMVKEHYLDGKIIDPKRAIPRDEQEKTSKIFVGGVSQEATESDFKEYFLQFGRVLDATLMMDKDTGRPRGFGFVTFDSESAVENALSCPTLAILGKQIEVKKAQPRGNTRGGGQVDERDDRGGGGGFRDRGNRDRFDSRDSVSNGNYMNGSQGGNGPQGGPQQQQAAAYNGMTPQMMAQYWQQMQRYMAAMSQIGRGSPMPVINPAMMQQAMQNMPQQMAGINPAMMQQMQLQQAAMMRQQHQQSPPIQSPPQQMPLQMAQQQQPYGNQNQGYSQHQHQQGGQGVGGYDPSQQQQANYNPNARFQNHPSQRDYQPPQNHPSSWDGMYDDVPPQQVVQQVHQQQAAQAAAAAQQSSRGGTPNSQQFGRFEGPPPNAPTGPRNTKPGSNYRGGRGGGGSGSAGGNGGGIGGRGAGYGSGARGGFHPYARNQERFT